MRSTGWVVRLSATAPSDSLDPVGLLPRGVAPAASGGVRQPLRGETRRNHGEWLRDRRRWRCCSGCFLSLPGRLENLHDLLVGRALAWPGWAWPVVLRRHVPLAVCRGCAVGAHVLGFQPPYGKQPFQVHLLGLVPGPEGGTFRLVGGALELRLQARERLADAPHLPDAELAVPEQGRVSTILWEVAVLIRDILDVADDSSQTLDGVLVANDLLIELRDPAGPTGRVHRGVGLAASELGDLSPSMSKDPFLFQQLEPSPLKPAVIALAVASPERLGLDASRLPVAIPARHLGIPLGLGHALEAGLGPLPLLHDGNSSLEVLRPLVEAPWVPELVFVEISEQGPGGDVLLERRGGTVPGTPPQPGVLVDAFGKGFCNGVRHEAEYCRRGRVEE